MYSTVWFKKFCKTDESLRDEHTVASHWKLTTTENIIKADPLTTTQEVAEELSVGHSFYNHLAFEANWKGEKAQ